MTKLNNKGFAISTMLYGILIIIILILYLILTIMNSSLSSKRMIVDDEKLYVNKCSNRQVALETCYKTYNDHPEDLVSCSEEYEAYTSCMGYEASSTYSSSTASVKETVLDYTDIFGLDGPQNTLVADENIDGRYVFVGSSPKNFIKIGTRTGRIISIEQDGTVKVLITDKVLTGIKIDTENGAGQTELQRWKSSIALNELRKEYSRLDYNNKMTSGNYYLGNITSDTNTLQKLYNYNHLSILNESNYPYGTITLEDYMKASANAHDPQYNCNLSTGSASFNLSTLGTTSFGCNKLNWIAGLSSSNNIWTASPAGDVNHFYVVGGNVINSAQYDVANNMYLVIFLSRGLTINTRGDGSITNPYVVSLK